MSDFKIERSQDEINDRLNDEFVRADDGSQYALGFVDAILWLTDSKYEA
jgi:hypothetical protein